MTGKGLIPRAEQAAHSAKVRTSVLHFLKSEMYTVLEVIQELGGYTTVQGAKGMLKKLTDDGYIKHHKMKNFAGRGLNIWGITRKGMIAISDEEELPERVRAFEPSRISLTTLDHKIAIQRVKIFLATMGYKSPILNKKIWDRKLPDIHPYIEENGISSDFVIEVELTIKSIKRYEEIVTTYDIMTSRQDSTERIDKVIWLTETEKERVKLTNIFANIKRKAKVSHYFDTLENFMSSLILDERESSIRDYLSEIDSCFEIDLSKNGNP